MRFKNLNPKEANKDALMWTGEYDANISLEASVWLVEALDEIRRKLNYKDMANDMDNEVWYGFYLQANLQTKTMKVYGICNNGKEDDYEEYLISTTTEENSYLFEYAKQLIIQEKEWEVYDFVCSEYSDVEYYVDHCSCGVGGQPLGYELDKETGEVCMLKTVMMINRSGYPELYDILYDYVLIRGEELFEADCSAEFIIKNDSYLVWFKRI